MTVLDNNQPSTSQEALAAPERSAEQLLQTIQQHQQLSPSLQDNTAQASAQDNTLSEVERIRSMVTAVASARQSSLEALEHSISQRIEQRLESVLTDIIHRLNNVNNIHASPNPDNIAPQVVQSSRSNPPERHENPRWQDQLPNNNSPLNTSNFNRQIDSLRFSDSAIGRDASRIAHLISSWDIKFNGSSKLSVESFIYRIESQVEDTLGGNFNILCEHLQSLLSGDARDWYWSYRRTVRRVTWPAFCEALSLNFEEHKTDTEIKESIRNRKQGHTELFDEYRNAIYKLSERLTNPIPEAEMVEILQRGLRPRVRQQLLYVPISTVTELRKFCLKGESLYKEISKSVTPTVDTNRQFTRRMVNEIDIDSDNLSENLEDSLDINEIKRSQTDMLSWNCRNKGHRYFDCLETRNVFCYGCGIANVYKPHCSKCNPGNLKTSEAFVQKTRHDQN